MKRHKIIFFTILSLGILYFFINGAGGFFLPSIPEKIALIPLDSRPCNTQYPELVGKILGAEVAYPEQGLDELTKPSDKELLWSWLAEQNEADIIIINIQQLFNGGLISSRDPLSYANWQKDFQRLKEFCETNKEKKIVLISIIPRLIPTQFTELAPYQRAIKTYEEELSIINLSRRNLKPSLPSDLPAEIYESYKEIFTQSELIALQLSTLINDRLVEELIIGQDDGAPYGPGNRVISNLKQIMKNEKIHFLPGADELSTLALVKNALPSSKIGIQLYYGNESKKDVVHPYENISLAEQLALKTDYLGLEITAEAPYRFLIHNDSENFEHLKNELYITGFDYTAIIDVAFTNRGDLSFLNLFLKESILPSAYGGWNTAGNSIGSELAYFAAWHHAENSSLREPQRSEALLAAAKYRYLRIADDLIYQGVLRDKLNQEVLSLKQNPTDLDDKLLAEEILAKLYESSQEDLSRLSAIITADLGLSPEKTILETKIVLPWPRTFEAKIIFP